MTMKNDGILFKDSWLAYIFYGILLCPFICLWGSLDTFPFGDKGAVGLFTAMEYIIIAVELHYQTIHHFGLIIISFIHGIKFEGSILNG